MPSQIPTQVSPKADWISSKAWLWDRKVRLTIRKARWQFLGMNGPGHFVREIASETGKQNTLKPWVSRMKHNNLQESRLVTKNSIRFKWLSLQHFRTSCQQLILNNTISQDDIFHKVVAIMNDFVLCNEARCNFLRAAGRASFAALPQCTAGGKACVLITSVRGWCAT